MRGGGPGIRTSAPRRAVPGSAAPRRADLHQRPATGAGPAARSRGSAPRARRSLHPNCRRRLRTAEALRDAVASTATPRVRASLWSRVADHASYLAVRGPGALRPGRGRRGHRVRTRGLPSDRGQQDQVPNPSAAGSSPAQPKIIAGSYAARASRSVTPESTAARVLRLAAPFPHRSRCPPCAGSARRRHSPWPTRAEVKPGAASAPPRPRLRR